MLKGYPVESFKAKIHSNIVVQRILRIKFVIETFSYLQLNILLEPFYVLKQYKILTFLASDQISDELYELKEYVFDP